MVYDERASLAVVPPAERGIAELSPGIAGRLAHVALVADARIDNLDELRRDVGSGSEQSTAELLIGAYLKWGEAFPDRISGDFALVLWDARKDRLLACRDPFGVRPLFYRASRGSIALASGIEQILRTLSPHPALDDQMIVEHLLWRYKSADSTFFREIRQIRPGHVLTATGSGIHLQRYWYPPARASRATAMSREDCNEEFRRLFSQSVERRLRSSSPVMIHVSGGLDSSAIAVVANRIARSGELPSLSLRGVAGLHPGLACDERAFIDAVARQIQFPIEHWDGTDVDSSDLQDPTIECPGVLPMIGGTKGDVSIAQRHRAAVILSGLGGDQLMMPMGVTQDMLASHDWSGAIQVLFSFQNATVWSRLGRLRTLVAQSAPLLIRRMVRKVRAESPDWLAPELRGLARDLALPERSDVTFSSHMQEQTWNRMESQNLVRAVDAFQKLGGALAVEYRFPYLDRDLVRFVLTIPYRHWPRPDPFARLHRSLLGDMLPPEIVGRFGKAEFTPALRNRIRRSEQLIRGLIYEGPWASEKYVSRSKAQELWVRVTQGPENVQTLDWRRVWAIVTLETWLRKI